MKQEGTASRDYNVGFSESLYIVQLKDTDKLADYQHNLPY